MSPPRFKIHHQGKLQYQQSLNQLRGFDLALKAYMADCIANSTDSDVTISLKDMSSSGLDVAGLDLSSHTAAQGALDKLDTAITKVDSFRADLGAKVNRLNYAADNLSNVSQNTAASRSRIGVAAWTSAASSPAGPAPTTSAVVASR